MRLHEFPAGAALGRPVGKRLLDCQCDCQWLCVVQVGRSDYVGISGEHLSCRLSISPAGNSLEFFEAI